jgi:hypothetical protein
MTTRNPLDSIKALATLTILALGLATVCSSPASAQSIAPTERMLMFNTAGAVGRMLDNVSVPGAPLVRYPTNASQPKQQWFFARQPLVFVQDGRIQFKQGWKISSVSDSAEVLSPIANQYWNGAPVIERKEDPKAVDIASRWETIRVPGLPFYLLQNVWNPMLCLTTNGVQLTDCNWNDSKQWFSLMSSTGSLK